MSDKLDLMGVVSLMQIARIGKMLGYAIEGNETRFVFTSGESDFDTALLAYKGLRNDIIGRFPAATDMYPTPETIAKMVRRDGCPVIAAIAEIIGILETDEAPEQEGDLSPFTDFIEGLDIDLAA